jgi:hypothetical protein
MQRFDLYLGETEIFIINEALDRLLKDMKKDPKNVRVEFDKMIENCTDYVVPECWDAHIEKVKEKFNLISGESPEDCCEAEECLHRSFHKKFYSKDNEFYHEFNRLVKE